MRRSSLASNTNGPRLGPVEIAKAVSAVKQAATGLIKAANGEGPASWQAAVEAADAYLSALDHGLETRSEVEGLKVAWLERAQSEYLQLDTQLRETLNKHGWVVEGQWPTLFIEHAISLEIRESDRVAIVAGRRVALDPVKIAAALRPLALGLLPKGFSPTAFMAQLAHAYDDLVGDGSGPALIFDVYKQLLVNSQSGKFWKDARAEHFVSITLEQFRARLSLSLEDLGTLPDGRSIRLFPPLDARDGIFLYQPAEHRWGYVGRIEFLRANNI